MKIRKPTTRLVDIGLLDHALRLPTAARLRSQKTICQRCGKAVTDEYFIAGFRQGYPNMILHESCCADEPAVIALAKEKP